MTGAGQRDARVRIEKAAETLSDRGEATVTWSLQREVLAHVRPLNARETIITQQLAAFQTRVFNIPEISLRTLDPFPTPGRLSRLVYGGVVWNIEQANPVPIERPKEYDFVATARAEAA